MYSVAGRPAVVLIVNLYQSAHVLSRSRVSYCCVSVHSSARPASQMPPNYADSVVCAVCWIKHLLSRTGVKSRVRVSKDAAALWDPPDASRPTLDRHSQLFCVIFRWAVREAKFKGETEKCGSKWVKRGRCSEGILRRTTHPFNGRLSGTTRVSRHQNDTANLDFCSIAGICYATFY